MIGRFVVWIVFLLMLGTVNAAVVSCVRRVNPPEPIRVIVSIPPLKGLVTLLLEGLDSKVETLIPVGVSEHGYEIPASKLASLAKADIVVYVGRGLEPQVSKFLAEHPKAGREVVKFADLITKDAGHKEGDGDADQNAAPEDKKDDQASDHDDSAENHTDDGHHHDHDNDPHLWLDPHNVKKLIPGVREAIERLLVARGELTDSARAQLNATQEKTLLRIDEIDAAYAKTLAKATDRTIVVAHDAYTLLAERYGLTTVAIAGLNASEPTMKDVRLAIEAVKEQGTKVVFVEPQLSRSAGDRVAKATGAKVLVLDPIGGEDWFATMSTNLDALSQGLGIKRE